MERGWSPVTANKKHRTTTGDKRTEKKKTNTLGNCEINIQTGECARLLVTSFRRSFSLVRSSPPPLGRSRLIIGDFLNFDHHVFSAGSVLGALHISEVLIHLPHYNFVEDALTFVRVHLSVCLVDWNGMGFGRSFFRPRKWEQGKGVHLDEGSGSG